MQSLELVFVRQFSADADWYFSQVNHKCFPEFSDNRHELNLFDSLAQITLLEIFSLEPVALFLKQIINFWKVAK